MSNVFSRACTLFVVFGGLGIGACASPSGPSPILSAEAVSSGLTLVQGVTDATLMNAGWSCIPLAPGLTICAPPGLGLPLIPPGPLSDQKPSYIVAAFIDHQFDHHTKLLRPDLYHGQPCLGGGPWTLIEVINYVECIIPVRGN
jgi:hypothetical protein